MKFYRILPALLFSIFLISLSFGQQNDMNKNMKIENKEMKNDSMMMKENMNMKKSAMKSDKDKNDAAINGYDPVSYFTDSKSVMGNKKYSYEWRDQNSICK